MRSPPPDPGEEVHEASAARGCFEVVEIDGGPARRKYPTDVAKLLFGDLASGPKPAELLQDDILRTQDREHAADRHFDCSSPGELSLRQCIAARNEDVDLRHRRQVNEIEAAAASHGGPDRVVADVVVPLECGHEVDDMVVLEGGDEIDVLR